MKQLDAVVNKTLRSDPDATVKCILRTAGEPAQYRAAVEKQGLKVVRTSTLINAITVEGKAKSIMKLSGEKWVTAVELDKPVHTM